MKTSTHQQNIIKKLDLRACLFYLNWLQFNKNITINKVNKQESESCRRAIHQAICHYFPNENDRMNVLIELESAYDENILPIGDFNWLKQDERAAFWLWGYLCKVDDLKLGFYPPPNAVANENWYERLNLIVSPSSHHERIALITAFFDAITLPTPPVSYLKRQIMDKLKEQWKVIYSRPIPLKWLPDEEESVLWAWQHLQKCQQEMLLSHHLIAAVNIRLIPPGLTTWFTPLNSSERRLALRAALDLWDYAPDTKRLFLLNLNKAWNQQKLRKSRTDKKALNTYLKNETKQRLDFMAAQQNIRISEMLEKLINERYYTEFDNN
ncbi:hypothetical protein [Providencia manganoxydans]|uniref:hypothetical protein n=1 Tax=Providencia manganoxydans TaxID=2923283 RepID=UPI0034E513BA